VAGKISGLRFQKRKRDWVNVFVEGEYAFSLPAVKAASLHVGQQLTDEEIERLVRLQEEEKAYERAVRFLGYRPRSKTEIERYLKKKNTAQETITAVIRRLDEAGYLDDEAFARFWVSNRVQFSPRGRRALEYELRSKGIEEQLIQKVLESELVEDEESVAYELARAKTELWGSMDYKSFARKLGGFLQRRGFGYQVVRKVVRRIWEEKKSAQGAE
jgi:regulatory protein